MRLKIPKIVRKGYAAYMAIPIRKRVLYTAIFVIWHLILLTVSIFGNKLQTNLQPLATRMERTKVAWLPLCLLIAIVSIPPLFGHEILAVIAGYVYGTGYGFAILTVSSIIGESVVYFAIRYWFRGYLDRLRHRFSKTYGVFVAVVEDGGILMLWFIRMSVIPPHFSTPMFAALENITWWKWMIANIAASPVKFYPPVFIGNLLRDKKKNSLIGDIAFGLSIFVTVAVLWFIRKQYIKKKAELRAQAAASEDTVSRDDDSASNDNGASGNSGSNGLEEKGLEMTVLTPVVKSVVVHWNRSSQTSTVEIQQISPIMSRTDITVSPRSETLGVGQLTPLKEDQEPVLCLDHTAESMLFADKKCDISATDQPSQNSEPDQKQAIAVVEVPTSPCAVHSEYTPGIEAEVDNKGSCTTTSSDVKDEAKKE